MGGTTPYETNAQTKYETRQVRNDNKRGSKSFQRIGEDKENNNIFKPQHPKTQTRKQNTTNMRHGNKRASNSYERDENNTIKKKKHTWGK